MGDMIGFGELRTVRDQDRMPDHISKSWVHGNCLATLYALTPALSPLLREL